MKVVKNENSLLKQVDFDNLVFGRTFTDHMVVCEYQNGRWGEMEVGPLSSFEMHPATHVLHYGQSVFEGLKAYKTDDGKINLFRIKDNLERLNISAERLAMPYINEGRMLEALEAWMQLDKSWVPEQHQGSLYIRPFLMATSPTLRAVPSQEYRFVIIGSPVGFYYSEPIRVRVESKYTRAAQGGVGAAKAAGNYAAAFMPSALAKNDGFDQLLWTDRTADENLEELGSANLFLVSNGVIYTPGVHDSILAGITRDSVIKIAREMGLKVKEEKLPKQFLKDGLSSGAITCMFATGTAASITFIRQVEVDGVLYTMDSEQDENVQLIKQQLDDVKAARIEIHAEWNHIL